MLATLVKAYWLDVEAPRRGIIHILSYMYAYSAYLFFDFAGYSAFAISFSYLMGVRTPPNFNLPFLARDIADFWTRWHISLSTWLRDNVYLRFLLAMRRKGWMSNALLASAAGLLLTFGLMGAWHGLAARYLVYGAYHAVLLIALQWWRRRHPRDGNTESPVRRTTSAFVTAQAVCLGFLIFSGRLLAGETRPGTSGLPT